MNSNITSTDPAVTRDVINNSKAAQRKYTRAMKNLVKNGWDSFRKFEKHGVFDITGQTVGTDAKGKITNDGWVQMAQAMRIYRDKHFETFRFAFVDKEGTVQDQITVCSCMPNKVLLGENLVKDVLEYAERTNTSVVAVHNHPSGNINQSVADMLTTDKLKRQLIDSNEKSLFQGHIILDHNTFGLYDSLGNEWKEIDSEVKGNDPLMKQHLPSFTAQEIRYPIDFKKIAESINSDDKWNCKDWVPVLFTDSSIKVSSIRYYPKKTLEGLENSEKIKEIFRTAGKSTGTTRAFLIVPDELSSDKDFLNAIQIHTMNGCFTDFYMDGKTSEYYALDSHKTEIFDGVSKDELRKNTVYSSTFTPPSEVRGHTKKSFHVADPMIPETVYSIANIKKGNIHSDMNLLLSDYFMHHKYFPPMIEKNGNIHLYCSVSDISNTSRINSTGQLNHNDTVEMVLSKKQIAVLLDYALKEKVLRHKKDPSFKIDIAKRDGINSLFDNVIREIYPDVSTEKRINNYMTLFKTIEHELKDLRLNDMQKVQQKQHKKIYNSGMGY